MTTHANLSPSKRHRWGACPASVREEAKYPEDRSSAVAIDGTHTHTLLEACIESRQDLKCFIGKTLSDGDGEFVVGSDRAERVQFALDYIYKRAAELGARQILSEQKVDLFPMTGRFDLGGHVDVTLIGDDWIEIIDYKDGVSTVGAVNNPQMVPYSLGTLCGHQDQDFKTIHMTIIQPKLRAMGKTGIDTWTVTYDELMAHVPIIVAEAAATDNPNAPFNPGAEQCKYCRAKGGCSALTSKALEASGVTFADLSKESANVEPTSLSDVRLREIMEAAPLIRQMLEGVEKEAQRRLEAGTQIDGLKLVRGRGSRDWALSEDEIADRLKKMGLPKEAIWETKLISPAKAEKVCWKKGDEDKRLSERQIKMLQSEYIKKTEGKITVALASDDRPAVTSDAASMFGAVFSDLPDFLKPKE